jgi:hypothetical protein
MGAEPTSSASRWSVVRSEPSSVAGCTSPMPSNTSRSSFSSSAGSSGECDATTGAPLLCNSCAASRFAWRRFRTPV